MTRGKFVANISAKKILDVGYWWSTLFKYIYEFCKSCANCQKIGGLKTKSLAKSITTILEEPFMKWALHFIGLLKLAGRLTKIYIFWWLQIM